MSEPFLREIKPVGLFGAREQARPRIPVLLRTPARWLLRLLTNRRGLATSVAGRVVRFLPGSEPTGEEEPGTQVQYLDHIQMTAFLAALSPGACVADVGAFRGTYTVLARSVVGRTGLVIAFEPSAESASILRKNLRINHFDQEVRVEMVAVAEGQGRRPLFGTGSHSMNSLLESGATGEGRRSIASNELRTVPIIDLDSFFQDLGRLPDVVKIDVEGAEFAVLRGAERIVASEARIFCELHPYAWAEAGHDGKQFIEWLRKRGRIPILLETGSVVDHPRYGPVELITTHFRSFKAR